MPTSVCTQLQRGDGFIICCCYSSIRGQQSMQHRFYKAPRSTTRPLLQLHRAQGELGRW